MPKLIVEEVGEFEIPAGKRLINALTEEAGIDQLHACGGNGRCTTCRVQFISGEPKAMTQVEKELLDMRGLTAMPGVRLSCQIECHDDMELKAISRMAGSGRSTPGGKPEPTIKPDPVWVVQPE